VPDDPPSRAARRRVRRGEGEVTQWPRGLTGYVPAGPEEALPSVEEDRTANRLELAGRLLGVLRSQGRDVEGALDELRAAKAAFASGDRADAARRVDRLFGDLERAAPPSEPTDTR
jgi:hypothetical protein